MSNIRAQAAQAAAVATGCLVLVALALSLSTQPSESGNPVLLQRAEGNQMGVKAARATFCRKTANLKGKAKTQRLSVCQPPKIASGEASGFPEPIFNTEGRQYAWNNEGWTASGVLDNSGYAADTAPTYPLVNVAGHVREVDGEPLPAGKEGHKGGWSTSCGCAVCPCRGDDDIDTVSNGDWHWPVAVREIKEKPLKPAKAKKCKKCAYTADVQPLEERYLATVTPITSSSHSTSKSTHSEKVKYITKYKTIYKENTVYVPVYDDPFWNPKADGRLAGEGIGMPQLNPFGALSYKKGAWYEWNKPRPNMLDKLGGTLDTDKDIDQPVDLGVWWSDSLPSHRFASNLDDSDSF